MNQRKVLKDYSLNEINEALYHDKMTKNLWKDKEQELKQLFITHSDPPLTTRLHIPSLWIPTVIKLTKGLVEIDPYIRFLQIKEKFGKLKVYTKPSSSNYISLIQLQTQAATSAIDVVTLIQLELFEIFNRIKKLS